MRLLAILGSVLILSSAVMVGLGSYGLDPRILGGRTQFGGDGFHGAHSARLEYYKSSPYVKINLVESVAFDELDEFSFQIKPTTENISMGIELWLDGDGDGKWSSKSDRDLKLYAKPNIWEDVKWPQNQWASVDTFDFEYSNKSSTKKPAKTLHLYMNG